MKNKRGFTLVELLAVIIMLGIISFIAIPAISKYLNESKDTTYATFENTMVDAAKNMVIDCISNNKFCNLPDNNNSQRVSLGKLVEDGYLDNMKDPDSDSYCDLNSYVTIKGKTAESYSYSPCLHCGEYSSDNDTCQVIENDGNVPTCGTTTGESTRWTKDNRTVSVECSDVGSGCEMTTFSKTFNTTTSIGKVTIRDRSGLSRDCDVNVYVDKTAPACNINIQGDYDETHGWYSEEVVATINNINDPESGVLTYGMGTSVQNRDYNKKTTLTVGRGITTIIGYTKDIAGNEGMCTREVRVGLGKPEFNIFYGYKVFSTETISPSSEISIGSCLSLSNATELQTSCDNPIFPLTNVGLYNDIEKVIIYLNSPIATTTTATITSGSMSRDAIMQQGSREIVFLIPKGSYNSFNIRFGRLNNKTYNLDRIEVLTQDGTIWSSDNIELYASPIDTGLRSVQVSYDNGTTWSNDLHKTVTEYTTGNIIVKNVLGMVSDPSSYEVRTDKTVPVAAVTAKKVTSGSTISSGKYSNEGLNFSFATSNDVPSGTKLYYCKNTSNSCTPNIEVTENTNLTSFNNITTNYYIRYRAVSNTGINGSIKSYAAKFDLVKPVCWFSSYLTIVDVSAPKTIYLTCTDSLSKLASKTITASHFTLSNSNMSIQSVSQTTITDGIDVAITLVGNNLGTSTITFKANIVKDKAANPNDSVSQVMTISNNITYPTGKNKSTVVLGDTVSIGDVDFYVIGHNSDDLLLLLKENVNDDEKVAFSSTQYWNNKIGTDYPGVYCEEETDTNCAYIYDNNSTIYSRVEGFREELEEDYGITIKEARLLSVEEAHTLKSQIPNAFNSESFWLGSAYNDYGDVVDGVGVNDNGTITAISYYIDWIYGIRPVIVI